MGVICYNEAGNSLKCSKISVGTGNSLGFSVSTSQTSTIHAASMVHVQVAKKGTSKGLVCGVQGAGSHAMLCNELIPAQAATGSFTQGSDSVITAAGASATFVTLGNTGNVCMGLLCYKDGVSNHGACVMQGSANLVADAAQCEYTLIGHQSNSITCTAGAWSSAAQCTAPCSAASMPGAPSAAGVVASTRSRSNCSAGRQQAMRSSSAQAR